MTKPSRFQPLFDINLTLFRNLKIALVSLGDALQLIANGILDLTHLIAKVHHREVIDTIAGRPICLARRHIKILRAQLSDHVILKSIGDRRYNGSFGRVGCQNRLSAIDLRLRLRGLRPSKQQLTVELGELLFVYRPPSGVDHIVLVLVIGDGTLGR